jgi:hypothetical protein
VAEGLGEVADKLARRWIDLCSTAQINGSAHDPRPPALLERIQNPAEERVGLVGEADAAQSEDRE